MLGLRQRRRPSIEPTLLRRVLFTVTGQRLLLFILNIKDLFVCPLIDAGECCTPFFVYLAI